jgi:hypothetical protein
LVFIKFYEPKIQKFARKKEEIFATFYNTVTESTTLVILSSTVNSEEYLLLLGNADNDHMIRSSTCNYQH